MAHSRRANNDEAGSVEASADTTSADTTPTDYAPADPAPTTTGTSVGTSPIEQAEAVRISLRHALAKTSELVTLLKRQDKQSRLLKTALESLKHLQGLAG